MANYDHDIDAFDTLASCEGNKRNMSSFSCVVADLIRPSFYLNLADQE